jgi:Rrf2 family protein
MHISAKADYAARALVELARDSARPLTCEAIASSQEIPFRFLKSVVGELRRGGLVRSQRGCEGGYWLSRPAEEITLLDVVRAVDGEVFTLRGEPLAGLAYPAPAAGLPGVWRSVEANAAALLGAVTIAALLSEDLSANLPGDLPEGLAEGLPAGVSAEPGSGEDRLAGVA